jgi:predicted MPP superfamily phosphohydrolase
LYGRGYRNILDIRLHHNKLRIPRLPNSFHGYKILHLSDLHVDMDAAALDAIISRVRDLDYDLCVLTGDYRAMTHGPFEAAVDGMRLLAGALKGPMYGVLGNHDSIRMLPHLEDMGIRMLLNESVYINQGNDRFVLAGIDDAHYFRVDNIQKTAEKVSSETASILLSHTPEVYRQAAHAGFDLFLCGHTHGGQICLPGGIPLTLDAKCPRNLGARNWRYEQMQGYTSVGAGTSVVAVRLNCPPEVTIHELVNEES